jgi:prefoldin subunit 5
MALPSEYYENSRFKKKLDQITNQLNVMQQKLDKAEAQVTELLADADKTKKALCKVLLGE